MGMRQPPSPPPQDPSSSPQGGPSPSPQGQQPPSAGGGGISKLVSGIYSQLSELMDALSSASQSQPGVVDPNDLQELTQIIKMYQQFVTQTLGSAPGASKPKAPAGPNQVSPMQGSQPSSNVRPVNY